MLNKKYVAILLTGFMCANSHADNGLNIRDYDRISKLPDEQTAKNKALIKRFQKYNQFILQTYEQCKWLRNISDEKIYQMEKPNVVLLNKEYCLESYADHSEVMAKIKENQKKQAELQASIQAFQAAKNRNASQHESLSLHAYFQQYVDNLD